MDRWPGLGWPAGYRFGGRPQDGLNPDTELTDVRGQQFVTEDHFEVTIRSGNT